MKLMEKICQKGRPRGAHKKTQKHPPPQKTTSYLQAKTNPCTTNNNKGKDPLRGESSPGPNLPKRGGLLTWKENRVRFLNRKYGVRNVRKRIMRVFYPVKNFAFFIL